MHTVLSDSNSVECEPGNRQGLISELQSLELFHSVLLNVQGLTKEKRVVLSKLIEKFVLVGLTETHCMYESFAFPGWTVYAAPRTVQRAKGESHGGVALLLRGAALTRLVRRLGDTDRVPPETVAVEFESALSFKRRKMSL